jgi:acetyl esterase
VETQTRTRPVYDPNANYPVEARDVEYRHDGTTSWLARVYQPQGAGPFPALIEIHGGAWRNGDRLQNAPFDEELAASGIMIAAIDFHSSNDAPYPAQLADINHATRWLKLQAPDFNATADRLGGVGFSSGGHLVMLSGMRPRDARYTAIGLEGASDIDATLAYVIMGWPVIDPYSRYVFAGETGRPELAEASVQNFGDESGMKEASPQHMLERGERVGLPPALLIQGAADTQLTSGMAERFVKVYSEAGGVIELGKYPGAPHGFLRDPGPDALDAPGRKLFESNRKAAIALVRSFIARQLV